MAFGVIDVEIINPAECAAIERLIANNTAERSIIICNFVHNPAENYPAFFPGPACSMLCTLQCYCRVWRVSWQIFLNRKTQVLDFLSILQSIYSLHAFV